MFGLLPFEQDNIEFGQIVWPDLTSCERGVGEGGES